MKNNSRGKVDQEEVPVLVKRNGVSTGKKERGHTTPQKNTSFSP